ncbi:MAG TPA: HEAT repeat domain-containing protein [Allosphingosinicella sp.]|nr:HEAT repeat domain-containing protein [Allosphingosinicella sp.]
MKPAAARGASAVLALARDLIEDDSAIAGLLDRSIAAASADPFWRPPLRASRNEVQDGLLLFSDPALTVQLAVMSADALAIKRASDPAPPAISFTGQRSLFRFVKAGGAILSFWTGPFIGSDFRAAAAGRCRRRERRRLADGELIELDGRFETFIVDEAVSDLVYVAAATPLEAGPVGVDYDPTTLAPIAASSTDDPGSRIQMMLALLRTMGRRDAAPLFAEMVKARHFHARWQAMRELLALDPERALPHLKRMAATDSHSEVREAAAATLAAFFPNRAAEPEQLRCLS